MWPDVAEQVAVERAQIDELFAAYHGVIISSQEREPDLIELSALATLLHSFYNGLENIFKRIALAIDGELPPGAASHRELLVAMATPSVKRPALISSTLLADLSAYLSFRHVFRHAYSLQLDWAKMVPLVRGAADTWEEVKMALDAFFAEQPGVHGPST